MSTALWFSLSDGLPNHSRYLSQAPQAVPVEKHVMWRNFSTWQIVMWKKSPHEICETNLLCGEIMCTIYGVLLHFMLFSCKIFAHLRSFPDFPSFSGEDLSLQMKQKHHKVNCYLIKTHSQIFFIPSPVIYCKGCQSKQSLKLHKGWMRSPTN